MGRFCRRTGAAILTLLLVWMASPAVAAEPALPGDEVSASTSFASPTVVEAGWWQTTLTGSGSQFFAYDRTIDNSLLYVTGAALAPPGTSYDSKLGVSMSMKTPNDQTCDTGTFSPSASGLFQEVFQIGGAPGDELDDCAQASRIVVEVSIPDGSTGPIPLALSIIEQAPITNADSLPAGVETAEYVEPPVSGDPQDIEPGTYAAPTEIESGNFRATLERGVDAVFTVPAGWGQTVTARAVTDPIADVSGGLNVKVLAPNLSDRSQADSGFLISSSPAIATAVSGPIRALNGTETNFGTYMAGTQYVVLSLDTDEPLPGPVMATLQVEVTGEVSGAPEAADHLYVTGAGGVDSVGPDAGGLSGGRVALVGGLGLLGLLCVSGGVSWLRRAAAGR